MIASAFTRISRVLCLLAGLLLILPVAEAAKPPSYIASVFDGDDPVHMALMMSYLEGYFDSWASNEQVKAFDVSEEALTDLSNAFRRCAAEEAFSARNIAVGLREYAEKHLTDGRDSVGDNLDIFFLYYLSGACPAYIEVSRRWNLP